MGSSLSSWRSNTGRKWNIMPVPGAGAYKVGCADIMTTRDGGDGIFARIFYPIESESSLPEPSSLPVWVPRREYLDGLAAYKKMSRHQLHFAFDWFVGDYRIPANWHAVPIASKDLPILVFSHGLSACRHFYSTFCTAIASHGYVVAAIEHRDESACWTYKLEKDANGTWVERPIIMRQLKKEDKEFTLRNKQVHKRVSECIELRRVLDELNSGQCTTVQSDHPNSTSISKIILGNDFDWSQFKGRLDMSRVTIGGHSFGAATAIATTAFAPAAFRSVLVLDGWMFPLEWDLYPKARQPMLFINAEKFQWVDNVQRMMRFDGNIAERTIITLRDVVHLSFTDLTHLFRGYFGRKFGLQGGTDPLICNEAVIQLCIAFMQKHLNPLTGDDPLTEIIEKYSSFAVRGTTLKIDDNEQQHLSNI